MLPVKNTALVNSIFVIIVSLIGYFFCSVKVKIFKILCICYYCPVKGKDVNLLQENGRHYEDVK